MRLSPHELRDVTLAQAIERADDARTLVSQTEWDEATRQAVDAARGRGVLRVGVADVVVPRAAAIVDRAAGRDTTVALLRQAGTQARWLARGLPLLALLLGLVLDRVANAHQVDLLSPPLLLVLGWNLIVYALLLWHAWHARHAPATHEPPASPSALHQWLLRRQAHAGRRARRGLAARVATDFITHWSERTRARFTQQAAAVLHLCAAAWAAGIALSLLLRGLVVSYRFGWESTFLDATQVHAIVGVLFAPLTLLFGLTPFSPQEVAATQNFAGEGVAGARWVWMYVGLLALVVVLPRLLLAAWAHWRQVQWARQCTLDTRGSDFDTLRQALPGDLLIGLACTTPALRPTLARLLAQHAGHDGAIPSAQGDRLRLLEPADAAAPVDAVVLWGDGPAPALPPAWRQAPMLTLASAAFGANWLRDEALFERLAALLPARQHTLQRLSQAWQARNEALFIQALQRLAEHLHACAALVHTGDSAPGAQNPDSATRYAELLQTLDAALQQLHGLHEPHDTEAAAAPRALPPPARSTLTPGSDTTALAVGTSAGAAAGVAAGAKVGAMIDVGTGGLTLGVGTVLGALLGGTAAWAMRTLQKKEGQKGSTDELLRRMTEDACTRYLVLAHLGRMPAAQVDALGTHWHAEAVAAVAVHWAALNSGLRTGSASDTALQPLLRTILQGILSRDGAGATRPATGMDSALP